MIEEKYFPYVSIVKQFYILKIFLFINSLSDLLFLSVVWWSVFSL